jgi:hypothetical protein
MITLEILIPGDEPLPKIESGNLSYEIDLMGLSDRRPSLWNELIIKQERWIILHFFDKEFVNNQKMRWLYEDINIKSWERFKFKQSLSWDFIRLVREMCNDIGRGVWILTDAQLGPRKIVYEPKTFGQFEANYIRYGLRINSATFVHRRNKIS